MVQTAPRLYSNDSHVSVAEAYSMLCLTFPDRLDTLVTVNTVRCSHAVVSLLLCFETCCCSKYAAHLTVPVLMIAFTE